MGEDLKKSLEMEFLNKKELINKLHDMYESTKIENDKLKIENDVLKYKNKKLKKKVKKLKRMLSEVKES